MKSMILFIKGIIIGIGKIVPGVSGAVLAVILKVYDKGINAIVNFKNDIKNNIKFLLCIGLGIGIGIILFSKIIVFMLDNYYVYTMLLFIGLIIGGIPSITKEITKKNYKYVIITLILATIISLFGINNNYVIKNNFMDYVIFFIGGIMDAIGTVVPGLSSTALLLIMGIYNNVIVSISNLSSFNINYGVLIPFGIGLVIGIIFVSIIISKLLSKYKEKTNSIILGFVISSVILLLIRLFNNYISLLDLFIGIIFMIIGIILSCFLG